MKERAIQRVRVSLGKGRGRGEERERGGSERTNLVDQTRRRESKEDQNHNVAVHGSVQSTPSRTRSEYEASLRVKKRRSANSREGLFEGRVRELCDSRHTSSLVGSEDGVVAEGSDGSCGRGGVVRDEETCCCSVPVAAAGELWLIREGRRRRGEGSET